jgi:hypothetical protein
VKDKSVASPVSTGGAGEDFQNRVGAYYLACALLRSVARGGHQAAVAREVRFQRLYEGDPLDDLIVISDLPSGESKLALQVKRDLVFAEKDKAFNEVVGACWQTFSSPKFNYHLDRFGIAISLWSKTIQEHYQTTLTWARNSATAADFLSRVSTKRFAHAAQREFVDLIRSKLDSCSGAAITEIDLWKFLQSMVVLHFDFQTDGSREEVYLIEILKKCFPADKSQLSPQLLSKLVDYAAEGNRTAGSLDTATLTSRLLADGFSLAPATDCRDDLERLREHANFILSDIKNDIGGLVLNRLPVITEVQKALSESSLVELVGPPGSGKSSVLRSTIEGYFGDGQPLVLDSRRLTGPGWNGFSSNLQLTRRLSQLLIALSSNSGPCVFINDIDRIIDAAARQTVNDLIRTIADFPLSSESSRHWRVVVSVREDNLQDLHNWFDWSPLGRPKIIKLPDLSPDELQLVADHSPRLRPLLQLKQLEPVIRNPFMLSLLDDARMLPEQQHIPLAATEVEVASIWWNRLVRADGSIGLERQLALLELGKRAIASPGRPLVGDGVSALVLSSLESDRILLRDPGRDVYRFGHDLLEDWTLYRVLDQRREDLAEYLMEIGQPLGLIRAVQLLSASVLEMSKSPEGWTELIVQLEQAPQLAPKWRQAALTGPLFSTRALDLLQSVANFLTADDAFRVSDLLVAARTIAVTPDWTLLPAAMNVSKGKEDLVTLLLMFPVPIWRLWVPLMDWLLKRSNTLPPRLRPEIARFMEIWQQKAPDGTIHRKTIGETALAWLRELERRNDVGQP